MHRDLQAPTLAGCQDPTEHEGVDQGTAGPLRYLEQSPPEKAHMTSSARKAHHASAARNAAKCIFGEEGHNMHLRQRRPQHAKKATTCIFGKKVTTCIVGQGKNSMNSRKEGRSYIFSKEST